MPYQYAEDLFVIVDVQEEPGPRHLICFLTPGEAENDSPFLNPRLIVGEFQPDPEGDFDPDSFVANQTFVDAYVEYMNQVGILEPEIIQQARENPGGALYLLDPRTENHGDMPPLADLVGGFQVDPGGSPVPNSFRYNPDHLLFHPETGPSGILTDRSFYQWMRDSGPDDNSISQS